MTPEPVRRLRDAETRDEVRSGGVVVWLGLILVLIAAGGCVALFMLAASRPGPAVSPQPAQIGTPHSASSPASLASGVVSAVGSDAPYPATPRRSAGGVPLSKFASSSQPTSVGTALLSGRANFANPSHGPDYLAIRAKRGTLVRICGAGDCQVMRSTDYGPKESTGDIADIALVRFAQICGFTVAEARRRGECDVTIEFLGDIRLPETDTAEEAP